MKRKSKSQNITVYPVMKSKCATCPFRTHKNGRVKDVKLVNRIQATVLNEGSQMCHHPRLSDKEETHFCRGARNYQLDIFHKIGFLDAPTDEAWAKKIAGRK